MEQKSSIKKVLYQKLGGCWYLFTEIEGELLFSPLPLRRHPLTFKRSLLFVRENKKTKATYIRERHYEI